MFNSKFSISWAIALLNVEYLIQHMDHYDIGILDYCSMNILNEYVTENYHTIELLDYCSTKCKTLD